jgi:hypothetical protein
MLHDFGRQNVTLLRLELAEGNGGFDRNAAISGCVVPSGLDLLEILPGTPCRATDCPVPSGLIASGDLRFFSTPVKGRTLQRSGSSAACRAGPVCHPAPVSSGLGPLNGGVSKLSRLLNQEDALSVPCMYVYFCPPHAPSRDAGILRKGLICRF